MYDNSNAVCAERKITPIEDVLTRLNNTQDDTSRLVMQLEDRLGSVLTPGGGEIAAKPGSTGPAPVRAGLTSALELTIASQSALNNRLRTLLDRIEL